MDQGISKRTVETIDALIGFLESSLELRGADIAAQLGVNAAAFRKPFGKVLAEEMARARAELLARLSSANERPI